MTKLRASSNNIMKKMCVIRIIERKKTKSTIYNNRPKVYMYILYVAFFSAVYFSHINNKQQQQSTTATLINHKLRP